MGLLLKFAGGCAALALIISLVFGFAGGNRPVSIVITAALCTLLGAAVGGGVYKVLELRVPEILTPFSGGGGDRTEAAVGRDAEMAQTALRRMDADAVSAADDMGDAPEPMSAPEPAMAAGGKGGEQKSFGDHIIINKVKIKNEPKLMAAAIRTLLAKDS